MLFEQCGGGRCDVEVMSRMSSASWVMDLWIRSIKTSDFRLRYVTSVLTPMLPVGECFGQSQSWLANPASYSLATWAVAYTECAVPVLLIQNSVMTGFKSPFQISSFFSDKVIEYGPVFIIHCRAFCLVSVYSCRLTVVLSMKHLVWFLSGWTPL